MEQTNVPNFLKSTLWDGQLPPDLAGLDWNFVRYLREEALSRFLQRGLPSMKEEDWRYTSLSSIEKQDWQRVLNTANVQETIPSLAADSIARLLFVDGYHSSAHARLKRVPPGLRITSLQDALQDRKENLREF
nr:hypothetical protein [Alphaproteobacteria bacterium]